MAPDAPYQGISAPSDAQGVSSQPPPPPPPPGDNTGSFDPSTAFSSSQTQQTDNPAAPTPPGSAPEDPNTRVPLPQVQPAGVFGGLKIFPLDAKKVLLGGGAVLALNLIIAFLFYLFYFSPKITAGKYLDSLKTPLASLKQSNKNVRQAMEKIFLTVTEVNSLESPQEPLKTSGIFPSKDTAFLPYAISVSNNIDGFITRAFSQPDDVAGITAASEDITTSAARALKTEVQSAQKAADEASASLKSFMDRINAQPKLPAGVKNGLSDSGKVNTLAGEYFTQARYIANYYSDISDSIIAVNTKINSFKIALLSAGNALTGISPQKSTTGEMKQSLSQVQAFLDQAKKDTEEIRSISVKLRNIPKETLPLGIDAYHAHNQQVYDIVIDYFTAQTGVVQGFITATSFLMTKVEKGELLAGDVGNYQMVIKEGTSDANKADATFVSALQSLTTEETTLALSFWQDNKILTGGDDVEKLISAFEASVGKLSRDSRVPFFN